MFNRTNRRFWMFALPVAGVSLLAIPLALAGGGWRPFGGGCHHGHGQMSAEDAREKVGYMAERVLDKVDATEEQEVKVDALLDKLVPEMIAHRTEAKELKGRFREALSVDDPDRAELEGLRQEALKLADKASQQALDAALELHAVLTPDQRQDLLDLQAKFRRRHGR